MKVKVLCIGDIVGRPGRRILSEKLKAFVAEKNVDCVIANAENAAGGSGLTPQIYEKLLKYGVNLVTLGDHTYRKKEIIQVLEQNTNIVRPANISELAAGKGFATFQTGKAVSITVISLIGRVFMKPAECPFNTVEKLLAKVQSSSDIIFVDFHAEATSEKIALAYFLDGRVNCVFGTHTHVQTADEKILPKGTAYITDIGMTGAHNSVIGRSIDSVIKSFRTQMPYSYEVATGGVQMDSVLVTVDSQLKKADKIERIILKADSDDATSYDTDDGKPEYFNMF
jgi:2',3'-cyclic-nucleotide 2'-phosphodiesterase